MRYRNHYPMCCLIQEHQRHKSHALKYASLEANCQFLVGTGKNHEKCTLNCDWSAANGGLRDGASPAPEPCVQRKICTQQLVRQEKRPQILTFGSGDRPVGWGSSTQKGWWPKSSCPPSRVCLPCVQKVSAKNIRATFSFPNSSLCPPKV